MTTPTATPEGATNGDLLRALLAATGRQTATKAVVDDLRAELHRRALRHVETEGTVPRWRLAGIGEVLLTDPQDRIVVNDHAAFAAWGAEHHPEHVTATIAVPAGALEAVLEALDGVLADEDRPVTLQAHAPWTAEVLAGSAVYNEDDGTVAIVSPDGLDLTVNGVGVVRGTPNLSVKLDREAKDRAAAEAVGPEGMARITAPLPELPGAELPGDVVHQLTASA